MRSVVLFLCLLSVALCQVYTVQDLTETSNGLSAYLQLQSGAGPYGRDISRLKLDAYYETETRLRIRITDANAQRWEVPPQFLQSTTPAQAPANRQYSLTFLNSTNFGFQVRRLMDNEVIFNTEDLPFVFEDQYISFGTKLPEDPFIYGLGERVRELKLETGETYTIFNKDDTSTYSKNLYGTHPFYMEFRYGKAHGVYLFNSNAMDVQLNDESLVYNVIGGVIDVFFFVGPTPDDVMRQYQEVIGKPTLPPYWAFGFHQCRWGYNTLEETKQVVQNYSKFGIPLETIWNDIDYMDEKKAFTFDPVRFPLKQVQEFVAELHKNNQHYIVILDPGMKNETGYEAYELGLQKDIFIKRYNSSQPIVNKVWPGFTVFPDFTNPDTQDYWNYLISKFYKDVPVDAIWLDMNEIATFCNGECDDNPEPHFEGFDPNHPPYVPGGIDLKEKTLRLDAQQKASLYYNTHNLYGITSSNMTRNALAPLLNGKRPVVITRSTFAGSGHYVSHWTGDNWSTFDYLRLSISSIINMNMFGMPFVGADIGGFLGDTNAELFTRWMQVGVFYPFSRNHNDIKSIPQEPYVFGEQVASMSRDLILLRYSLLPYYYTLFYNVHTQGGAVFRALFFEFPQDFIFNIGNIDDQFMIGKALLVSPVVEMGEDSVDAYFPAGNWYDYYTGELVSNITFSSTRITLPAPLYHINVHVRGGFIIPKQKPAMTIAETRANPYELLIAFDATGNATGELYLDDGISDSTVANKQYTYIRYNARYDGKSVSVTSTIMFNGYAEAKNSKLTNITIYGLPVGIKLYSDNSQVQFETDGKTGRVRMTGVNFAMDEAFAFTVSSEPAPPKGSPLYILLAAFGLVGIILFIGFAIALYFIVERVRKNRSAYETISEH
jgi:alpha-glucosidase (family GH31 glycosyl hydrolase)